MALEPAPDLEQAHKDMTDAFNRGDVERLRELISTHPAAISRGTAPDEVFRGPEAIHAAMAEGAQATPQITTTNIEAYADGDLGYVYAENTFIDPDGNEYPSRGLAVCRREDGQWRYLHGLAAIPIPNEMLTTDSPFVRARTVN